MQTGLWKSYLLAPSPQMPLGLTSGSLQSSQRRKHTFSCCTRPILLRERKTPQQVTSQGHLRYVLGIWTAARRVEVDIINSLAPIWPTPIETTRGPWIRLFQFAQGWGCCFVLNYPIYQHLNNPHSLLHFCLCSDYESLEGEKKCVCSPVCFLTLKSCPGKIKHEVIFC